MSWLGILIALIYAGGMIGFISVFSLVAIWTERKVSAHVQDRLGPMETGGWHGWSQTIADMLKLLQKEDIVPDAADKPLFKLAPYIVLASCVATFAVLPFGANLIGSDLNIGIFYLIAMSSLEVLGILLAGWASNNKWALYGGMRAASQMISYEIPIVLSLLVPIMTVGSLSMQDLVHAQAGGIWNWGVFAHFPFAIVAFIIYFWSSLAEANRVPFDLPEGESELVAGFNVEYSGMRWAMFYLAEFANMFLVSGVVTALFLGGWHAPLPFLEVSAESNIVLHNIIGFGWFAGKAFLLVLFQQLIRWTLPRLRVDQLMHVCWKIFLPFSFANVLIVSLWIALAG